MFDKIDKTMIWLKKPSNTMWVLPTFGAIMSVVFIIIAYLVTIYIPNDLFPNIEHSTLNDLLSIISSSMLAVSTFSLSIMVTAFSSASNSASPRATELIMADDNTRVAIASFISSFIYSVIAKIFLSVLNFGVNGIFIIFISTILVLMYLIYTLIKWVQTLSSLGRMENTLNKIYNAALNSYIQHIKFIKSTKFWNVTRSDSDIDLSSNLTGYVTFINLQKLQNLAQKYEFKAYVRVNSGDYISTGDELINIYFDNKNNEFDNSLIEKILPCFVVEKSRTYQNDPVFGFVVLSEVGQKAMSKSVNDQGTAISVLTLISKILLENDLENVKTEKSDIKNFDRISLKELDVCKLITKSIVPIARDGSTNLTIDMKIQNILASIYKNLNYNKLRDCAKIQAKICLKRALVDLNFDYDKDKLTKFHNELFN